MAKVEYPQWKVIAWRFIRTFFAVLLVELSARLSSIQKLEDVFPLLLVPAVSAGLVSLAKAFRDWVASDDYGNIVHKMIV